MPRYSDLIADSDGRAHDADDYREKVSTYSDMPRYSDEIADSDERAHNADNDRVKVSSYSDTPRYSSRLLTRAHDGDDVH